MRPHYYHRYPPDVWSDMREKEREMTVIRSTDEITVVVWTATQPTWNGQTLARAEARRLIDHKRFFWDDSKDRLIWKGPAAELTGDAPSQSKSR